jgi:hypothetical protein
LGDELLGERKRGPIYSMEPVTLGGFGDELLELCLHLLGGDAKDVHVGGEAAADVFLDRLGPFDPWLCRRRRSRGWSKRVLRGVDGGVGGSHGVAVHDG